MTQPYCSYLPAWLVCYAKVPAESQRRIQKLFSCNSDETIGLMFDIVFPTNRLHLSNTPGCNMTHFSISKIRCYLSAVSMKALILKVHPLVAASPRRAAAAETQLIAILHHLYVTTHSGT